MDKKGYLSIFSLFFFTWFVYSLMYSQVIPYMTYLGFNEGQRSLVFSISAIIGIIVQFVVGYLIDKYQRSKIFFVLAMILTLIFGTLGYLTFKNLFMFYFLCISLFIALFRISSNIVETWSISINDEVMKKFGLIRVFGSIGWAVGSFVTSLIISQNENYPGLSIWIVVISLIILLLTTMIPDSSKVSNPAKLEMKVIRDLFRNRGYSLSVVIYFILFIVFAMDNLTVIDKMVEVNSTAEEIGLRWSVQALVELPLLLMGLTFIKKYSARRVVAFTALVFAIRYILYGFAQTGQQIIIISLLQALTYPFLLLTQKVIVNQYTPVHLRGSGHLVMTAITSNIPIILVPLMSAFLHQYISYSMILIIGGLLCLISFVLSFKLEEEQ